MKVDPFSNSSVFVALSEKDDGDMSLGSQREGAERRRQNRKEFLGAFPIEPSNIVLAELSHGDNLEVVSRASKGEVISDTDGLLTQAPDLYLGFTVADCLPVFLFEPDLGLVGLIHCGWQGLALDILCKTCGKIRKNWGKDLKNLQVFIGPGICKKHFEISKDVAKQFSHYQQAIEKKKGRIFLDLKKVAKLQFLSEGGKEENIQISPQCTYELGDKYFSYRRNQTFFRNLAVISRNKD